MAKILQYLIQAVHYVGIFCAFFLLVAMIGEGSRRSSDNLLLATSVCVVTGDILKRVKSRMEEKE